MRLISDIFRSYAQFNGEGRHVNGTDKQSNHNYGDAYESLFAGMIDPPDTREKRGHVVLGPRYRSTREQVQLVMEVGVADGACMLAWRDVFPNALIVGMDIHPSAHAYGDRLEFHLGDQRSKEDCERAACGSERMRHFDMIVEDALHELDATLLTFLYLWPFVKPGGLYVIEEFANIAALCGNIRAMWPHADIVETKGPFGGVEPLVVFRKQL